MVDERAIVERYGAVGRSLNERGRRLFAAAEARLGKVVPYGVYDIAALASPPSIVDSKPCSGKKAP